MNTIEGLSLTNDNYIKALELLEDRYGNKQAIITAHTKNLLKLRRVESNLDVISLRRLYDDVQAQVRSLQSLGITEENYGTFLAPIIMELLPHEVQLNINRTLDEELWNLTRLLTIIKCEINAREKCTTAMEQERVGKNVFSSEEPLSAASLFAGQKSKPLCVFCKKPHWSDKCRTISDPSSRKQFLKQGGYCFLCLKEDHKIRDCKRKKGCFYCKGLHNSAICSERQKKDDKNNEDSPSRTTNNSATCHVQNQLTPVVLLQTAAVILENPNTKQQVKVKVLLDAGSQRTYISEKIQKFLSLSTEDVDDVNISTFGNSQTLSKSITCVLLVAKNNSHENILIKALCLPCYVCLY